MLNMNERMNEYVTSNLSLRVCHLECAAANSMLYSAGTKEEQFNHQCGTQTTSTLHELNFLSPTL